MSPRHPVSVQGTCVCCLHVTCIYCSYISVYLHISVYTGSYVGRYVDDERVWGVETQQMYAYEYRYDEMYDADTPHNQVRCVFVCWRERGREKEGEREREREKEMSIDMMKCMT